MTGSVTTAARATTASRAQRRIGPRVGSSGLRQGHPRSGRGSEGHANPADGADRPGRDRGPSVAAATLDDGDLVLPTALASATIEDPLHVFLAAEGVGGRVIPLRLPP